MNLDDIFGFLKMVRNTSEAICPALQEIKFSCMQPTRSGNVQPFVDMIVSRWGYAKSKGSNFSVVEELIDFDTYLTCGQRQELQRCILEGLHYQRRDSIGLQCFENP